MLQYQVLKKCVLYDVVCPPETYMMDRIESTQGRKKKKVREEEKRLIAKTRRWHDGSSVLLKLLI